MTDNIYIILFSIVVGMLLVLITLYVAAWLGISVGKYGSLHMVIAVMVMRRFLILGFLLLMFYHAVSAGLKGGPRVFWLVMQTAFESVKTINAKGKTK